MTKIFTCNVIPDPDDPNELAIQFTDELLAETGWKAGDVLTWTETEGGWTLTKTSP